MLVILASSLPILITCAIIYFDFDARLGDYRPYAFQGSFNDETGYWLWVRSFSQYGFQTGYNVPSERPAPAPFNHFGAGSPLYVYMYGAIGRLVGWVSQLPILINFILLFAALNLFILILKLDSLQILFIGLVVTLFWPVLLFLPTSFQETLNQSIGILMALVLFLLLDSRVASPVAKSLIVLFVFISALTRLSWGFLLFPVIFLCLDGKMLTRSSVTILLGSTLLISSVLLTNYLVPPENNSLFRALRPQNASMIGVLIQRAFEQWMYLWRHKDSSSFIVVFEMIAVITWGGVRILVLLRKKLPLKTLVYGASLFDMYNLSTLLTAGFIVYLAHGFGRTFTPAVLVSVFLMIARKEYKLISVLLIVNILFSPAFFGELYPAVAYNFTAKIPGLPLSEELTHEFIVFDDETDNPWCNTLLIPLDMYDYRLTAIPPGIGVSYIDRWKSIEFPLKSKYLLLDQESSEYIRKRIDVEKMVSLPIGDLFYNLESGCDTK